jgi:flavodoxin
MNKIASLTVSGLLVITGISLSDPYTGTLAESDADKGASATIRYTLDDVQQLQDFVLAKPTDEDLAGKPYDLNGDNRWDSFDLCLMKSEVEKAETQKSGSNTIVVYFSRTGNTEKIAEYLIDITGADSYEIEAAVPYTDEDIAYNNSSCRANQEQNDKSVRPEIAEKIDSLDGYDTVLLGYPIWWGEEPRIIDSFIESYDFSDKNVALFCTSASSGISSSERNITSMVPIGNYLAAKRFSASASKEDVKTWYDSLGLAAAEK